MAPNLLAQIPYSATCKLYIYEIFILTVPGSVFSSVKWEEKIIFSSGIIVILHPTVKQLLHSFFLLSFFFLLNLLLKCVQLHPQIHIGLSEGLLSGLSVTWPFCWSHANFAVLVFLGQTRAVLRWELFPAHFHLLVSWPLDLGLFCDNVSFFDHQITWGVRQESLATSLSLFPWIPFIISYSFKCQMPSLSWCSNCPQGICHFLQVSALIFALYKVSQGHANKIRIPTPSLYVFPRLLLLYVFPLICFCTIALICRLKVLWK